MDEDFEDIQWIQRKLKRCEELKMMKPKSQKPCDISQKMPIGEEVFISKLLHANSINDFYILLEKDEKTWDYIESMLPSILAFDQELYRHCDVESRTQVAAYYYAPQKWKRLKILDFFPDGTVKVVYIDYGNTDILPLNHLRQIPPQFEQYPPMAIHCSLDVVPTLKDGKDWNEDMTLGLRNMFRDKPPNETPQIHGRMQARCLGWKSLSQEDTCNIVILQYWRGEDWGSLLVDGEFCTRMGNIADDKNGKDFSTDTILQAIATTSDNVSA